MSIYGYIRVSTTKQDKERQVRNIRAQYPNAVLYQDAYTGTKMNRPSWEKLMKVIKSGDVIVFDEVSRMSRNADEGVTAYHELYARGVELVFLKEPHINTEVYRQTLNSSGVPMTGTDVDVILSGVNKYLMILAEKQIRLAFERAQSERELLSQRTKEGIETARENGKQIGAEAGKQRKSPKGERVKEGIKKYGREFNGSLNDSEVIKLLGCSSATFYKYRDMLREEAIVIL